MIVHHITSIESALSILRSGVFRPKAIDPADGDNGLNLLDVRPGYWRQEIESTQCKIVFECSLPVVQTSTGSPNPLASGVLHDQHPWRMFIRGPIPQCSLRVTHVLMRDWAINEYLNGRTRGLWPSFASAIRKRQKLRLLREFRSLYRAKCANIKVAA